MNKYHILVCDDDTEIVRAIRIYLERAGYEVYEAYNGRQALEVLEKQSIHCILLDIMMPLLDGMEALEEIRRQKAVPIILVSAKGEAKDKIAGLEEGADDYITKPFDANELVARVGSQIRRYTQFHSYDPASDEGNILRQGNLQVNLSLRQVEVEGRPITLTPTEFRILVMLMEKPGHIYSSEEIYEKVWREASAGSVSTVAVHIRHLREKIEINAQDPQYIKVVWGQGYKLDAQEAPHGLKNE